jgi:hypothetical protein
VTTSSPAATQVSYARGLEDVSQDSAQARAVFDDIPKTTSANGILTPEAQKTLIDALQGRIDASEGVDMSLLREVLQEPEFR